MLLPGELMCRALLMLSIMNCLMMWKYILTEVEEPEEREIQVFVYQLLIPGKSEKLRQIERMVQVPFHKVEIPTGKDVCRNSFFILWINY